MFNVPNKAMITLSVIQFNVVKDIYISKVAGMEVRPQCCTCLVEIWGRNPWLSPIGHSQTHSTGWIDHTYKYVV